MCGLGNLVESNTRTPKERAREREKKLFEDLGAKWLLRFLFLSFFYALVHSLEEKKKKSNHKRLFVRYFLVFFMLRCVHFNISYARTPFSFFFIIKPDGGNGRRDFFFRDVLSLASLKKEERKKQKN